MSSCFDYLTATGRSGKGVVLCFAAGNDVPAQNFRLKAPWAAYRKTIAVAASSSAELKASSATSVTASMSARQARSPADRTRFCHATGLVPATLQVTHAGRTTTRRCFLEHRRRPRWSPASRPSSVGEPGSDVGGGARNPLYDRVPHRLPEQRPDRPLGRYQWRRPERLQPMVWIRPHRCQGRRANGAVFAGRCHDEGATSAVEYSHRAVVFTTESRGKRLRL